MKLLMFGFMIAWMIYASAQTDAPMLIVATYAFSMIYGLVLSNAD